MDDERKQQKMKLKKLKHREIRYCQQCRGRVLRKVGEDRKKYRNRKFCSHECMKKYKKKVHERNPQYCKWCREEILPRRDKNGELQEDYHTIQQKKYCSHKCELEAYRRIEEERQKHIEEENHRTVMQSPSNQPVESRVRPPMTRRESVPHVRQLCRAYTVDAVNALVGVLRNGPPNAKVQAAHELLDRGWGKATQNTNLTIQKVNEMNEEELLQLLGMNEDEAGRLLEQQEPHKALPHEEDAEEAEFRPIEPVKETQYSPTDWDDE